MQLTVFVVVALFASAALGQTTDRYRREEIDPVNLQAEVNQILADVSTADSTLASLVETFPTLAQKGQVDALSTQVASLREVASSRVLSDSVVGLSNLVDIVTSYAEATGEQVDAATEGVPDVLSTLEDANNFATETFATRLSMQQAVLESDELISATNDVADTMAQLEVVLYADTQLNRMRDLANQAEQILPFYNHFSRMHVGNPNLPVFRWAQWSTYSQCCGWYNGNNAEYYGGVNPSTWGDGNGRAYQMSSNTEYMRTLFNKRVFCGWSCMPHSEEWRSYSSTNSLHGGSLFRIRNTTPGSITWNIYFYYSSYGGWNEYASWSLNGANNWNTGSNCGSCYTNIGLSIPGNRISTIKFISSSSAESGTRAQNAGFYNDCLRLPEGLEYVDDLDTYEGGNLY